MGESRRNFPPTQRQNKWRVWLVNDTSSGIYKFWPIYLRTRKVGEFASLRTHSSFGSREDQIEWLSVSRRDTYGVDLAFREYDFEQFRLFRRFLFGIQRVLVVAPASVKYRWKTEIEKFCNPSAQVIDGLMPHRKKLYGNPAFFNLASYELVLKDIEDMQNLRPELIILDEAQRIRNWETATARVIKQLKSRYAFVLTGTPLENKLEELYSVVEFVCG